MVIDRFAIVMIVQFIAVALICFDILYVANQKASELQSPIVLLLCSTMIMFVGYILEIYGTCLEESMLGTAVAYIGKPYVMFFSFIFVCRFYGRKVPKAFYYITACFCSIFFLLVATNERHHLYYATEEFDITQYYSPLVLTRGPLYYLYILACIIFFIGCALIVMEGYKKATSKEAKQQGVYIILMIVSGLVGYAIYLSGVTNGYDSTMMGVFFGTVFLSLLFFRYRIFDVLSIAKDQALRDSPTGFIVMDSSGAVIYSNKFAEYLYGRGINKETIEKHLEDETEISIDGRIYSIIAKDLVQRDEILGKSIEITDITYLRNYQSVLEAEIKERTEKLEAIQYTMVVSIAEIVEARSLETGEHVKRTAGYVEQIVDELQKDEKYRDVVTDEYKKLIVAAAPLHDIGKIAIEDAILTKPGKLTKDEFEKIKVHSKHGAEVIERSLKGLESPDFIRIATDIAKYHHERWDGTGYPDGLKGEEIPLCARIMALADVFDAVSSKRCYKDALSKEDTLKVIIEETGTHFDPYLSAVFVRLMREKLTK